MIKTYYAAHEIDKYVKETFFSNKNDGYFVDIGAHDGININNTYYFENEGWSGICFEPVPEIYELLKLNRKCDVVNKALSDVEETLDFFSIKGHAEMLSGLLKDYPNEHMMRIIRETEQHSDEYECIKVNCSTFSKEIETKNIDLLSIDTEGAELSILKTIDFDKYKIGLMIIEYNYDNQELISLLNDNNFEIVNKIGCDLIVKNTKL
jgi:FkbM family methyltransferase